MLYPYDIFYLRASQIKKDLSRWISLIISNKTGDNARVSGFIALSGESADYSLIWVHCNIYFKTRQIF